METVSIFLFRHALTPPAREEESHLTSGDCKVFGDLLDRFGDLSNDNLFIKFFDEVLLRREIDQLDTKITYSSLLVGQSTSVSDICV